MIRHQEGRDYGSRRFKEVLDTVDATRQEPLRAAAVRLAPYTHGPLREALQHFRFEVLDMPLPFARGGVPPLDELLGELAGEMDDLDDDDEELFLDEEDILVGEGDILDELEAMEELIDKKGLRGAPRSVLRDFAGFLHSQPPMQQTLARIARECEEEDLGDELSPELHTILFPRKGRRGRW